VAGSPFLEQEKGFETEPSNALLYEGVKEEIIVLKALPDQVLIV
jgi:hypothetical protein